MIIKGQKPKCGWCYALVTGSGYKQGGKKEKASIAGLLLCFLVLFDGNSVCHALLL